MVLKCILFQCFLTLFVDKLEIIVSYLYFVTTYCTYISLPFTLSVPGQVHSELWNFWNRKAYFMWLQRQATNHKWRRPIAKLSNYQFRSGRVGGIHWTNSDHCLFCARDNSFFSLFCGHQSLYLAIVLTMLLNKIHCVLIYKKVCRIFLKPNN